MEPAQTQYADAGDLQIAYQVWGRGEATLICVPGLISHIEIFQEIPEFGAWMARLTQRFKVVIFDKRGQGMSDRGAGVPGPEQRMDDITAVADAEGLARFALFGNSEGAAISLLYAATFPARVKAVAVFGGFARFANSNDYDLMFTEEQLLKSVRYWGTGASGYSFFRHRMPAMREQIGRFERMCCTPNAYRKMLETNIQIDIRDLLSEVKVPVMVMHRRDDGAIPVANGRYLADHMPEAKYVEFAHGGHIPWMGDIEELIVELEDFLLDPASQRAEPQTQLSTVLFTDIVGSSEMLTALGDKQWRDVLDQHDRLAAQDIAHYQGTLVKNTGDGLLATFDGPARAINCAKALQASFASLDLEVRAGLHIGEVEPRADDITGLAVHVAARVMDKAGAGQVLITRTLADLIAGSGLSTETAGAHELKGLAGQWPLVRVV